MRPVPWISVVALFTIGCGASGASGRDAAAGSAGSAGAGGGSGGSDATDTGGETARDAADVLETGTFDANIECAATSNGGTMSWFENGEPYCATVIAVASWACQDIVDGPIDYAFSVTGSEPTPPPDGRGLALDLRSFKASAGPGTYSCFVDGDTTASFRYAVHPWQTFLDQSCTITLTSLGSPDTNATGTFAGYLIHPSGLTITISNGVFNAPVHFGCQ